jgi:hypothetical protein
MRGQPEGKSEGMAKAGSTLFHSAPHLKAVWEEARVHHRHIQVDDEQLGEDLVERLLVVLLWVARLDRWGGSWLGRG